MSDIDEIKSRLSITDIIGKHVKLKKAGRNFKGLCPFHGEKTPSFVVSPDRQIFHCFGCGKGGTIFDFVMEYHHVDFGEALEDLAAQAGVTLSRRAADSKEGSIKQKILEANHLASEYYQYVLTKHALGEKGKLYLKNRGISDKSIKTFTLGYSPNSWDGLYKFLRKKGYEDELMEKAGLVLQSSRSDARSSRYYDRFRGRIMFTLKDHRGNVVGFAGRVLDPEAKEAKYINTSETPVYSKSNVLYGLDVTKDAIQKANEAVIMEGELDVISSFQEGISNGVAIKGTALTEGHVRLLRRFTDRLAFALDSDMAGDAASRRGIEIADSMGLDMRVVTLPSGKDPDEAARENAGLLKKAIKDAVPVYDYFLSSALARFDVSTAYGKKKISEELLPVVGKIDNPIVRNHYVKKLATTIGTSEDAITEGMRRAQRSTTYKKSPEKAVETTVESTRPEKLEIYILALLLQGKTVELFEDLQEANVLPEFTHPTVHKIMDALVSYLAPTEDAPVAPRVFLIKDFAEALPAELIPTLDEAFLWDLGQLLEEREVFSQEWQWALKEFRRTFLRRKIYELTRATGEEGISEQKLRELQVELKTMTDSLRSLEKSS
jgi:DNA primase